MGFAAGGLMIWGLVALATVAHCTRLGVIEALFLLSPLVLVPLGLFVVQDLTADVSPPGRLARLVQPIGAVLVAVSFWTPTGPVAGAFATAWALVCALAAINGSRRLVRGGYRSVEGLCANASLVYLFVGSVWLVLSRQGATPFHYSGRTVLLAAVHFHFTGFALPVVAAATARARGATGPALLFPLTAAGILIGPALLAAGNIRQSPAIKLVGALVLVVASMSLAGLLAAVLRRTGPRLVRALLALSAFSLFVGMWLVAVYALGEFSARNWLLVSQMARWHGTINALGFATCGLLGWAPWSRNGQRSATPAG
jgi:hypothetical protein